MNVSLVKILFLLVQNFLLRSWVTEFVIFFSSVRRTLNVLLFFIKIRNFLMDHLDFHGGPKPFIFVSRDFVVSLIKVFQRSKSHHIKW